MTPPVVIPTKLVPACVKRGVGIQGSFPFPGCPFPASVRTSFTGMTEGRMIPSCFLKLATQSLSAPSQNP